MRSFGWARIAAAAVAAAICFPAVLPAQTGTHAALIGRVVDKDGADLPGVTITAKSDSTGMPEVGGVTASDGHYRIAPLVPAADYVLVAELPGYAKVEMSPVDLDPGKTTTVNFSLIPSSAATDKVTVTGKGEIVDVASTKTTTNFNSEFIEGLPILGRTYQDILTLAPGVTDVDGDGNPNVNGARATDFQTRLDGANTTDPVTGTFGQNLNLDSISEIEIITAGASAEFSQAQGGFANIVTKSGSNDFTGSFKFFFRSDLFDNDGANNNDVSYTNLFAGNEGFTDIQPYLTLGGPFVRDRLWYFLALEYIHTETPVNTLTSPVLQTVEGWNNFLKFTWQVNPANRISAQINTDPRRFSGFGLRTGVAPESDFYYDVDGATSTVRWTYNISPSVLLETMVSRLDLENEQLPVSDPGPCPIDEFGACDPFREDLYTSDQRTGIITGPWWLTYRDERTRDTLRSDLSIFLDTAHGSHNIKTGVEYAEEGYRGSEIAGTLRFEDYTTRGGFGSGPVQPGEASGSIQFTEWFPGAQAWEATKDNWGLYVQDSYKPRPNVSLSLGLRYDREDLQSNGYGPFNPMAEAAAFLELFCRGKELPPGCADFFEAFKAVGQGSLPGDINGDGKDVRHCSAYDLDGPVYGDGEPDGTQDDFWIYYDGDFDGVCDCDNPWDLCVETPDGVPDGMSCNPMCDRESDDMFYLLSVFTRHQFDETAEPFEALLQLVPDRDGDGNPARCPFFPDPNFPGWVPGQDCEAGKMVDPDDYPGRTRVQEEFGITTDNLAPRLSVSWDPWANNKTKLFATWGRYYDKLFLGTVVPELGPDPRTVIYDVNDRNLGSRAPVLQTGRFSVSRVDRDLQTPYTDEATLGFERELAPEWVVGLTWIRRRGHDQLQDIDVNHYTVDLAPGGAGDGIPDDFFGRVCTVTDDSGPGGFANCPDGMADLYAWNPMLNRVFLVGNFNRSSYDSLQLVLTRRLSRNWQMTASYVWSEAYGDAESFLSALGDDPGTLEQEYGPLAYDQTHVLKFNAVAYLAGNQNIGTTIQWASGLPFSLIRQGQSVDSMGSASNRVVYPTGQRNDNRNEGAWLINLSWRKNFTKGRTSSSIGVEVENLLNSDDLTLYYVEPDAWVGATGTRRFGRRWQLSAQFHF